MEYDIINRYYDSMTYNLKLLQAGGSSAELMFSLGIIFCTRMNPGLDFMVMRTVADGDPERTYFQLE